MNHLKKPLTILLVGSLLLASMAGCNNSNANSSEQSSKGAESSAVVSEDSSVAQSSTDSSSTAESSTAEEEPPSFDYSEDIAANGYWDGITAKDHVEITKADYEGISIPADIHAVTDEAVQTEIDGILSSYPVTTEVTDRAIEEGDTVNIDYVGSVDGVEFEGGNTGGTGTSVTAGSSDYIDDFLTQIIGHSPGETFDVNVTFPEVYEQNEELNGKDAVFVTTINYIEESNPAELTDEFVKENLSEDRGYNTVEELRTGIREELKTNKILEYLQDYLFEHITVTDMPPRLVEHLEASMVNYYEENATYYGMELDEFLEAYVEVKDVEELKNSYYDQNYKQAALYLIAQAIAEDIGYETTEADLAEYFGEDYSMYEETYGLPYMNQITLYRNIIYKLSETAVLE